MMKVLIVLVCIVIVTFQLGCKMKTVSTGPSISIDQSISKYEDLGRRWGKSLNDDKRIKPTSTVDEAFVNALYLYDPNDKNAIGYFFVNTELKEAFKRGFRVGYQNRIADLVLGPHITKAAGLVGSSTSKDIVTNISRFDNEWDATMRKVIDVFIVLISEGSKTDRELFINEFSTPYSSEYERITDKYSPKTVTLQQTQGGTLYYLPKDLKVVEMPNPQSMQTIFYTQAFKVMGDELGRRYGTNLVKRDELVDMLRRSKPALAEGKGIEENLGYIFYKFRNKYGADTNDLFKGVLRDAGMSDSTIQTVLAGKYPQY